MNFGNLFSGDNLVPTLIVAVASFVLGIVVELIVCKLTCSCGKKTSQEPVPARRNDRRDEPRFEKRHPAPADGSIEIYVGNLSYDLTEDQLRAAFEKYGKVNSARIVLNRFNNKSKGFGFVHMPNRAEADAAVAALNETDLCGRKLRCNEARNVG